MKSRWHWLGIPAAALCTSAGPQAAPEIDNARVTVWDLRLEPGASGPATPRGLDTVILFLEGGLIRTVDATGTSTTVQRGHGDAVFVPRGASAVDTLVSGGPAHEIVIALKDEIIPPIVNDTGLPLAFPRPGSVQVIDNDRVTVWRYSWVAGVPTPMHFHSKDVVVAYRYDGALKSVQPDGTSVVHAYKEGSVHFNKGNRAHYEVLTTARQSAVMMELK